MTLLPALPVVLQMALLFVVGLLVAAPIHWATDAWAWRPRWRSPWRRVPEGRAPREWLDCLPLVGWWRLRREADHHGHRFWLRPLMVELMCGLGLASLYWWEVGHAGLIAPQVAELLPGVAATVDSRQLWWMLHIAFVCHAMLGCLMMVASLIDLDDRIIPDQVTVPGTLLGLLIATLWPLSMLPQATQPIAPPQVGLELRDPAGAPVPGFAGPITIEPVHMAADNPWPNSFGGFPHWRGLAAALGCWWLWCFAFTRRRWRGRHGWRRGARLMMARIVRDFGLTPLREVSLVGTLAIAGVWWWGGPPWQGLLTALVGMVGCGGTIWLVRIFASAALGKEAMGFGDVTLMMMIGTFVGWQAGVLIFFLAPFAALVLGVAQLVLGRGDALPYGPFLCLATALVVVRWGEFWSYTAPLFAAGWLVPIVLVVCLMLCGAMLAVWSLIKRALGAL